MKLFGCTKTIVDKKKNEEIVQSREVFEVVSVQCYLVGNQYQLSLRCCTLLDLINFILICLMLNQVI